jgi:hypothetical protein
VGSCAGSPIRSRPAQPLWRKLDACGFRGRSNTRRERQVSMSRTINSAARPGPEADPVRPALAGKPREKHHHKSSLLTMCRHLLVVSSSSMSTCSSLMRCTPESQAKSSAPDGCLVGNEVLFACSFELIHKVDMGAEGRDRVIHKLRAHRSIDRKIDRYIHPYINTYDIQTCMHTSLHTYTHTDIQTCIHTYIHTYIHTDIHTYLHHTYRPDIDREGKGEGRDNEERREREKEGGQPSHPVPAPAQLLPQRFLLHSRIVRHTQ